MKVLAAVLIFAAVVSTGQALKCFKCNSFVNEDCKDDFNFESDTVRESYLNDCAIPANLNATSVYCKKVKMWFDLNDEVRVHRSCGYEKRVYDEPCFQSRADDHIVDTCQCDADECNPAPPAAPLPALLAVLGSVVAALRV